MKNIREIARLAGVSHSTVSRVINGVDSVKPQTRERVERVMAEYGYRPNIFARGMLGQAPKTLGVVIPNVMDPFFSTVISSIERSCRAKSVQLLIAEGKHSAELELEAINFLLNKGCGRLIVHSVFVGDDALSELLAKSKEIYLINRFLTDFEKRCVSFDNYSGGRLAARALIERGRKQIAIVSDKIPDDRASNRVNGFKDELIQSGVGFSLEMLFTQESNQRGGNVAARTLLSRGVPCDGVLCFNDMMAAGVVQALGDNGVGVPEDVSVVGFDDIEMAKYFVPRLSTVHYPVAAMAENLVEGLLLELEGVSDAMADVILNWSPTFVARDSH